MNTFRVLKVVGLAAVMWAVLAAFLRDPFVGMRTNHSTRIMFKLSMVDDVLRCQEFRRAHGCWPTEVPSPGTSFWYRMSESPDGPCHLVSRRRGIGVPEIHLLFNATNVWFPDGRSWTNDSEYDEMIRFGTLGVGPGGEMVFKSVLVP